MSTLILGCDGICSIDLAIDVQAKDVSTTGFVIGSKEKMTVVFTITNRYFPVNQI